MTECPDHLWTPVITYFSLVFFVISDLSVKIILFKGFQWKVREDSSFKFSKIFFCLTDKIINYK